MMLLPPEKYDGYQRRYQQQLAPEIRLQDDIESLLDREQLPDDAKAKILGHLITRFQKVSHAPPEPIRVRISDDKPDERESRSEQGSVNVTEIGQVVRDILKSVPQTHRKFVPMILEKLKTRLYSWNERGEFVKNNYPIKNSKIADFFSYLMRNSKRTQGPNHFIEFLTAIDEINIPVTWVANEKVAKLLKMGMSDEVINTEEVMSSTKKRNKSKSRQAKFSAELAV
ncbi:hypothetical protein JTE90_016550 [Oedothorax gibbosus]|uniref:Uncharacterized protein n=1 Tax=Oedothorax gibbosus TaxID=931172 RepID=A0AAV6TS12_9ARAC|nr:hypothetical protein JTE90_016550 [Oedothorax gibbosus]